ncbi:hypothetical protein EVAR_42837_1 [Eumeta japonica]|uniref:Uncharacterized protein n=1 Tax=Eumeta variegata TaxID=151549 RepID=A0A4C1WFE3_EUMVA|nr:hypothetical protein EVAR_42837_1 [Eumeta japonica]
MVSLHRVDPQDVSDVAFVALCSTLTSGTHTASGGRACRCWRTSELSADHIRNVRYLLNCKWHSFVIFLYFGLRTLDSQAFHTRPMPLRGYRCCQRVHTPRPA